MAHDEIMQELDNLQRYIMPLFIETLASKHSDRIDDIHALRSYGVFVFRQTYEKPDWDAEFVKRYGRFHPRLPTK